MPFEAIYRANLGTVAAFFARRSSDPQTVADLTSETFARAIESIRTFEGRGTARAWLIAIARAVYARHCADVANRREAVYRLAGQVVLQGDELDDLVERIDAQREGRDLMARMGRLSEVERSAVELVDLIGIAPQDAARALNVSPGTLRVRLFRGRGRLRKE
ncbi:MAG: RNA polymerase sigma factor [Solirubrobacteraceae bacterium]